MADTAGRRRHCSTARADWDRTGSWMHRTNGARVSARRTVTAPATEDAARWEGWGTALKPGQEMWWLARKPLRAPWQPTCSSSGRGSQHRRVPVDGAREHRAEARPRDARRRTLVARHSVTGCGGVVAAVRNAGGRWPANIVFSHSASCEMTGTRRVRGDSGSGTRAAAAAGRLGDIERRQRRTRCGYADARRHREVEAWSCADDCPVAELDRQSGVRVSGSSESGNLRLMGLPRRLRTMPRRCRTSRGDTGGASRFYPRLQVPGQGPGVTNAPASRTARRTRP